MIFPSRTSWWTGMELCRRFGGRLHIDASDKDVEHTLDYKVEKLINLVKMSKKTVFVVDAINSDPISCTVKKELETEAQNKLLLASYLKKQSLVELIIQFGHDGIPQRAGFHPDQGLLELHVF